MTVNINGMIIKGSVSEIRKLGIVKSKIKHEVAHDSSKSPDLRRNDSYPSGKRPWTPGRKSNGESRSSIVMRLIGMPKGTVFEDLTPGSKEQKNYWRATQFLRGKVSKLNLIK